jgi:hypothetical protein
MDDVLVLAATDEEFINNLRQVFQRFRDRRVTLNPEKCRFGLSEIEFVGHKIDSNGLSFTQEKRKKLLDLALPVTVRDLQTFLGMANYFRDHVKNHSIIAKPLHDLIQHKASAKSIIRWNSTAKKAFHFLEEMIQDLPTLYFLHDDAPVYLYTDACDYGIGAYLYQEVEGQARPVCFISKALSDAQLRWSTHEKEAYAIFYAFTKLEHLIRDIHFTLYTDHENLTYINTEG